MYTAYFGFNTKPFKPKDPKNFYRNINFDAACADILDGVRERRGFILLTGEAGVGKTFVLRRCIADGDDVRFVFLVNASLDFPDILNYLCTTLELPVAGLDAEQQKQFLLDSLVAQARRNRVVALLVDDAQHLADDVLLRLRAFVETPPIPGQRLQVVLAGLPEIADKLDRPELRDLRDSVRVRCHLDRLSTLETGLFIAHQLKAAGYEGGDLLSPAAVERIGAYCKGVPRAIAILCDTVLLFASLQSERDITPELVDEAAQSCFLGEQSKLVVDDRSDQRGIAPAEAPLTIVSGRNDFDLDLPEFDFSFDFGEKETKNESAALPAAEFLPESAPMPPAPFVEPPAPPYSAETEQAGGLDDTVSLMALSEPTLVSAHAASSPPGGFAQLLDEVAAKLDRGDARDREALRYFRNRYQRLLQGDEPTRLYEFERRIDRLTETQQPVFVGLATTVNPSRGQDGVLCALLINPTWWLYREIRLRLRSTDLVFANDGQIPPMRLLDGRDAQPAYLSYRCPRADLTQTTLWLELDLCDHRGEWHAYDSRFEIRLDFSSRASGNPGEGTAVGIGQHDRFWPEPPAVASNRVSGAWLLADGGDAGDLVCTWPLELEADSARAGSLRTATEHALGRGTLLTRALLLAADPTQAPARIELVSRPFMIFGRHSSTAGTGFGDFTLGFVPKYTRISRLHCVVCALGDQLTLMPASDRGYTYTGRNGRRLERGRWEMLETGDMLEVCDLYRLKLVLAWDRKWEQSSPAWDPQPPREKFGRYLLDLIDVLRKRDQQGGADELRIALRNRYLNLLRVQDRVAQLNGVGNPGALLYARFEREDAARQQIAHFYVPKWLSLGSSPEAGLRIDAEDVRPRHAELLFRDGMYWIQNLADPGTVRIGHHGLATNEVLALEAGDVLRIGTAQFTFEAY
ncbi:MAG TPA: AAA family ATPase [Candidatus Competibacter sp.]|nr:AAA family ATPase [Candidatus Competibacter sp.]